VAVSLLDDSVHADNLKVFDVSTGRVAVSAATSNTFLYGIKYARGGKYLIEDDADQCGTDAQYRAGACLR
jgi:hypothetical protein